MPFGDGTGPLGMGPMTGRGAGFCAGFGQPGFASPLPGRRSGLGYGAPLPPGYGYGLGRGFGRGLGRRWWGRGGYYGYPWW